MVSGFEEDVYISLMLLIQTLLLSFQRICSLALFRGEVLEASCSQTFSRCEATIRRATVTFPWKLGTSFILLS